MRPQWREQLGRLTERFRHQRCKFCIALKVSSGVGVPLELDSRTRLVFMADRLVS